MSTEIWKKIKKYPSYMVSNKGRVQSNKRTLPLILKHYLTHDGYPRVGLYDENGKNKHITIHRLVALEFIPNYHNHVSVNHIDGNKENNNVENLEWCSYSENNKHAFDNKLNKNKGENHHSNVLSWKKVNSIRSTYNESKTSTSVLANNYNCSISTIMNVIRNKIWYDESYSFKYEEKDLNIGEDHGMAKLTESQVVEIRLRYSLENISYAKLAKVYGMERSTIGRIIRKEIWKHL